MSDLEKKIDAALATTPAAAPARKRKIMLGTPSAKLIEKRLRLSREKAKELHEVLKGIRDPESYESVRKWVSQCHNRPSTGELKMEAANEILDGSGVEAIFSDDSVTQPRYAYVNMGDTYTTTVVRERGGKYLLAAWGDLIERDERRGIRYE
jgi:vacuolar-type H+-ATPase subunit E/Vma4